MRVLELDPDLAPGLDSSAREEAAEASEAELIRLQPGTWKPPIEAEPGHLGLLVVDGLLSRTLHIANRQSVELLAQGDVLRPWILLGPTSSVTADARWSVLEPTTMAVLDPEFAQRVARWPQITGALMDRLVLRSRWLAVSLAISNVRRVDDRLVLLFWHLADRRGRMTGDGIVIPLKLSHSAIATLVGAQRPTVSTALGQLRDRGVLVRTSNSSWLLRGDPPSAAAG
jgi:CRP/FNR family transcriptional regulator, cyclic AMP receptor protein